MDFMKFPNQPEYDKNFWNAMRGAEACYDQLVGGLDKNNGTYEMPSHASSKVEKKLTSESVFYGIATRMNAYKGASHLILKSSDGVATFVPDGAEIPIYDGLEDFDKRDVNCYKIASIIKLSEDFVYDAQFNIEDYLSDKLAVTFANAEDNAFINGTGVNEPTGILAENGGAEIGVTASQLSYDDVISLYYGTKAKYRKKGVWLMNDETALALRKLKDSDGNYLWNSNNDTILGKPVMISEHMPNIGNGNKPIAFGDFSYYWIIPRTRTSVRSLVEKFAVYSQVGYLAIKFIDGVLMRTEAIKVLQIAE